MTVFGDSFEHGFATLVEQHGESVSYKFRGNDTPISRTAIVSRDPPALIDQVGDALVYSLMITFSNNETDGVLSRVVDSGGDEVYVSLQRGGTDEWRPVYHLVSGGGGTTQVAVR